MSWSKAHLLVRMQISVRGCLWKQYALRTVFVRLSSLVISAALGCHNIYQRESERDEREREFQIKTYCNFTFLWRLLYIITTLCIVKRDFLRSEVRAIQFQWQNIQKTYRKNILTEWVLSCEIWGLQSTAAEDSRLLELCAVPTDSWRHLWGTNVLQNVLLDSVHGVTSKKN
jgi:hypothetical protein